VVFKTTAIDRSAIPPHGHFIRKIANSGVHGAVSLDFSQTTAIDDSDCALLLTFSIRMKLNGWGTSVLM
jgi:anti-anti-sigma regulatory factor